MTEYYIENGQLYATAPINYQQERAAMVDRKMQVEKALQEINQMIENLDNSFRREVATLKSEDQDVKAFEDQLAKLAY